MAEPTKPGLLGNLTGAQPTLPVPPALTEVQSNERMQGLRDATKAENDRLREESNRLNAVPTKFNLPNFVDISQIQDIYAALRDGDYWTAFARGIGFLNAFTNPPKPAGGLRTTARVMNEIDAKEFERTCALLDTVIDGAEDRVEDTSAKVAPQPRVGRSANAAAQNTDISFSDVMCILNMVRNILQQFRQNRNK